MEKIFFHCIPFSNGHITNLGTNRLITLVGGYIKYLIKLGVIFILFFKFYKHHFYEA